MWDYILHMRSIHVLWCAQPALQIKAAYARVVKTKYIPCLNRQTHTTGLAPEGVKMHTSQILLIAKKTLQIYKLSGFQMEKKNNSIHYISWWMT